MVQEVLCPCVVSQPRMASDSDHNAIAHGDVVMWINPVPFGRSKGVRIPASVVRDCGLGDELGRRVETAVVVRAPARGVREVRYTACERMAAAGDDAPVRPDTVKPDLDTGDRTWRCRPGGPFYIGCA